MRGRLLLPSLIVVAPILLAGCTSRPPSTSISQTGVLKVHPGLLGQPVPPELQARQEAPVMASPDEGKAKSEGLDPRAIRSIYFDLDGVTIKAESLAALQAHAQYLAQHRGARLRLEGNTDERGPEAYNKALGLKRARMVKAALVKLGAASGQIAVFSLGGGNPKLNGHDEAAWAENRRTDIIYLKE